MELQTHPASTLFPMMNKERFCELLEDIKANGLRVPITLQDGMILDGRNRYKACQQLGIEPQFETFDGNPWEYVWSLNGNRRDLVQEQRYLIWLKSQEKSGAWQAEQDRIKSEANRKRSEAMQGVPSVAKGEQRKPKDVVEQTAQQHDKDRQAKAAASQTNRGAVARGDRLYREHPELAEKVISGELKPSEAHRQAKKSQIPNIEYPTGKYRVIYVDPPWHYNDQRLTGDHWESTSADFHYPTMTNEELMAVPVGALAADDSVLLCWATFPLLPDCLRIVSWWGFKYKTAFVWDKSAGSFGHYHNASAELLLIATKGSCLPDSNTKEDQVQQFSRAGHSRKPDEWRTLIDRLYKHGPRIELFHRGEVPEKWEVWGNQSNNV